jgi:outer membrane receptor protein involved in Fe transport
MHTSSPNLGYIAVTQPDGSLFPISLQQYVSPFSANARAQQLSLYAQDQWTMKRLTLQGAVRFDHPWSWFPDQTEPASRFFPGVSFPRTDVSPATTTSRRASALRLMSSETARPRSR